MKNTIRCCISCILPCGALDVIRIVHSNGYVEEISGTIKASDVMRAHPKHVLKKPSSPSGGCDDDGSALPKIVIVPPDADLQRGKIYFLMPLPPNPDKPRSRPSSRRKKRDHHSDRNNAATAAAPDNAISMTNNNLLGSDSDQYLTEILSEKASTHRERRRGRVAVWRPHLDSICESPSDI